MTDWYGTFIASLALVVSILTAAGAYLYRRRESNAANLTAYFHRNQDLARVDVGAGQTVHVGYNLVIWNQGPATGYDVRLEVRTPGGAVVELSGMEPGEFPLRRIDSAGRYPIQFAPAAPEYRTGKNRPIVRRYDIALSWRDDNGRHEHTIPLRRGQTRT